MRLDYGKDVKCVYRDATRFLVLKYRLLSILSLVEHPSDISNINHIEYLSWVPLFFNDTLASPLGAASWFFSGLPDGYRQYLSLEHYRRLHRRARGLDFLSLDGFQVDRVVKITDVVAADLGETLIFDDLWYYIFDSPVLPLDENKMRLLGEFGTTVMAGLPFERPYGKIGEVTPRWILSPPLLFIQATAVVHAHMRAVYSLPTTFARNEVSRTLSPGDEVRFQNLAKRTSYGSRVYRTKKGKLGLGLAATKPGDEVCVLLGGNSPFILRSMPQGWFFIGETYLHDVKLLTGKIANKVLHGWGESKLEAFDLR